MAREGWGILFVMSRKSAWVRVWFAVLLTLFVSMQALAAACDVLQGPEHHELACAESVAAAGAPEMKGAWPQWHAALVDRGLVRFGRVAASPGPSPTLLAALPPDLRNVSILLLNLRQ